MAADGTGIRRLTDNQLSETHPTWSPDGRRIAFSSARTGFFQIWTVPSRGGRARRLSHQTEDCYEPAWAPTGRWVVYACEMAYRTLVIASPEGRGEHRLTRHGRLSEADPAWTPDGRWIVFVRDRTRPAGRGIFSIRPNGTGLRRLIPFGREPAVSPEGRRIVFIQPDAVDNELWIASRNGAGPRALTDNELAEGDPSWRPR
jgi:Tol biopolymer transport system component